MVYTYQKRWFFAKAERRTSLLVIPKPCNADEVNADGKSQSVRTMLRRENDGCEETNKSVEEK